MERQSGDTRSNTRVDSSTMVANIPEASSMASVDLIGKSNLLGNTATMKICTNMESEAMKKWKEMKQNGFLSHPNGGRSIPEPQHGKKSRMRQRAIENKRKSETLKFENDSKQIEATRRKFDNKKVDPPEEEQVIIKMETIDTEQDNKTLKDAPCSGLLSGVDTGIVRRVKSCEEVHAVLESIVRLEKKHSDRVHN